ncbi:MAG: glucose-6-phosphate isomerase family protein [Euryarchaeota archaeon]|nr:glucose-6-phosphate isomerase family protein [Euryarchaeota archaeon]
METWTELKFGKRTFSPVVRTLEEMKEVVFDKRFLASANMDMELYYMFRDVSKDEEDANKIKERGLRYDITIIPPNTLGSEFVKTAGHYHPYLTGSKLTYPEMYEVLEGEAHYLLQKRTEEGGIEKITEVVVVKAKKGDTIIIPPNYGHVTINPSKATLKMANWVARTFSSIYEPMKRRGGAAYFELATGEFIKDERYETVPDIRFLKASDTWLKELELGKCLEMYELLREPEKLDFLINPDGGFT